MENKNTEVVYFSDLIQDIPEGHEADWKLYINGWLYVGPVARVELVVDKPDFSRRVSYGLVVSEGNVYDGVYYAEGGGGGTAVVAFARIDGEIYVAVVKQFRRNMNPQNALCMPGGYQAADMSAEENAQAERGEEITNQICVLIRSFALDGSPGNFNRGLHDTSESGSGVKFFAFEIDPTYLHGVAMDGENGSLPVYEFADGVVTLDPGTEKIQGVIFVHWTVAVTQQDLFIASSVARLLAYLAQNPQI